MNIGEKIKYFRLSRNMTQEQLAQKAKISFSTLRKYEANERNPKYEQLVKIAAALDISVNIFMDLNIQSISDLLSILFRMEEQVDLKINTMQELDVSSSDDIPVLHFKNSYINQILNSYHASVKRIKDMDSQYQDEAIAELQNRLLDNGTGIHSDRSSTDSSSKPVFSLSPSDRLWHELSSDCTEEEKAEMLEAAAFTKNCLHHSNK